MGRGERDYTQRVLATVNPTGILGGRLIFLEDFESRAVHYHASTGEFSIASEVDGVWRGEAAGKLNLTTDLVQQVTFSYPIVTKNFLAAEIVWRPSSSFVQTFNMGINILDGTIEHLPQLRIYYDGTNSLLQYLDATSTYVTLKTLGSGAIPNTWHYLYVRVNLTTFTYDTIQLDNYRAPALTIAYPSSASGLVPTASLTLSAIRIPSNADKVYVDDLILMYEEP